MYKKERNFEAIFDPTALESNYAIEYATGENNFNIRNNYHDLKSFVKSDLIKTNIESNQAISLFAYSSNDTEGELIPAQGFVIDIDNDDLEIARQDTLTIINYFKDELTLKENEIAVFFSGNKGFHIAISSSVLGIKSDINLDKKFKVFAEHLSSKLSVDIDLSIYKRRGLIRLVNSKNLKSGLFKVSVKHIELENHKIRHFKNMAEESGDVIPLKYGSINDKASKYWNKHSQVKDSIKITKDKSPVSQLEKKIKSDFTEEDSHPICIQNILSNGVKKGTRDNTAYTLSCYFRIKGYSDEECYNELIDWNSVLENPLSDKEIMSKVESAYDNPKSIGCNNNILKDYCSDICTIKAKRTSFNLKAENNPAPKDGEKKEDESDYKNIHLTDIENAELVNHKVEINILIAGISEVMHSKYKYFVEPCSKEDCPECDPNGKEITLTNPIKIINLIGKEDQKVVRLQKAYSGFCSKSYIKQVESITINTFLASPAHTKSSNEMKDTRNKIVYCAGHVSNINGTFKAIGYVITDPNNQKASFIIEELKPLGASWNQFKLTDSIKKDFEYLKPVSNTIENIEIKLDQILKDISENITFIFGKARYDLLLGMLITYHSVLEFEFNSSVIKGHIEMASVGCTGTGKSQIADHFQKEIGIVNKVDCGASNRQGILYSLDNVINDSRCVRWGAYPLGNGSLCILDEIESIDQDQWEELRSSRSSGKVIVKKSVFAEHPCNTRLIMLGNSKTGEGMDEFIYPIEALKKLMKEPDIRRFTFFVGAAKFDVDKEDINKKIMAVDKKFKKHLSNIMFHSISRAWTRKVSDISFESGVTEFILDKASDLDNKFGIQGIPLVGSDIKNKITKMSVALASLLHSTDDSYEKVIVQKVHVEYIIKYLDRIYSADNCKLKQYAEHRKKTNRLSDEDYNEIENEINNIRNKESSTKGTIDEILNGLRGSEEISIDKLSSTAKEATLRRIFGKLKSLGLVNSSSNRGYHRLRKLVLYFNTKQKIDEDQEKSKTKKKPKFKLVTNDSDMTENNDNSKPTGADQECNYTLVNDSNVNEAISEIQKSKVIAVDIETTGLDSKNDKILLIQVKAGKSTFIFDMRVVSDTDALKAVLEDSKITKIIHNAKFEYKFFKSNGIILNNIHCTMIAEQVLTAGLGVKYKLSDLVKNYQRIELDKDQQKSFVGMTEDQEFTQEQLNYSAIDVRYLEEIYELQLAHIDGEELMNIYELEMQVLPIIANMELAGFGVDKSCLEKITSELLSKKGKIESEVKKLIGNNDINIKSPKQLKEALDELGINLKSTAKDKLIPHIDKPVIKKLLEFKELEKLTNTYGVKLIDKIQNSRIYSEYNQLVDTGRFSCNKPNIQQIPKDHGFRECFKAPKGKKLIVCDLSQCELRIMAELSGCKSMIDAYEQGKDLHREMASKIFETQLDKVTDKQRTASKSISFGLIYGMTAFGLAKQLDIETEEAEELIENYFKINPEIKDWIEKTQDNTLETCYTKTIPGRKRYYEINDDMNEYEVSTILRQSTNAPVQGTGADWLKMAIVDIDKQINEQNLNASLVAIIHDEVVIEGDEHNAEKIKIIVENSMINAGKKLLKKIPVEVDSGIYNYWTH